MDEIAALDSESTEVLQNNPGTNMKNVWPTKMAGATPCEVFADWRKLLHESKDQSPDLASASFKPAMSGFQSQSSNDRRQRKLADISKSDVSDKASCDFTEIFRKGTLLPQFHACTDPVGRSCLLPDTGERMIHCRRHCTHCSSSTRSNYLSEGISSTIYSQSLRLWDKADRRGDVPATTRQDAQSRREVS